MFGSKKKEPKKPDRFIKILRENPIGGIYTIVMVDTVTGVNYLVVEEDQTSGGVEKCPMRKTILPFLHRHSHFSDIGCFLINF